MPQFASYGSAMERDWLLSGQGGKRRVEGRNPNPFAMEEGKKRRGAGWVVAVIVAVCVLGSFMVGRATVGDAKKVWKVMIPPCKHSSAYPAAPGGHDHLLVVFNADAAFATNTQSADIMYTPTLLTEHSTTVLSNNTLTITNVNPPLLHGRLFTPHISTTVPLASITLRSPTRPVLYFIPLTPTCRYNVSLPLFDWDPLHHGSQPRILSNTTQLHSMAENYAVYQYTFSTEEYA